MTTSGTYTFGIETEAVDLIEESFERCGIRPSQISAEMLTSARRSLMFLASSWSNDGPKLWEVYQHIITLVPGDPDYELPTNTIYVLDDAVTRQTVGGRNLDIPLSAISRSEYAAQPDKATVAARPTSYYLQRTITPVLFVWPVLQAGQACSLVLNLMRIGQDIGKLSNTLDAPQRAMDALAADLAWRLSGKFAADRKVDLKADRDEAYSLFNIEDRERVPLRIMPDVQSVL